MRKLILVTLVVAGVLLIASQNNNNDTVAPSVQVQTKIDKIVEDIKQELDLAQEDKELVLKELTKNKLLLQERDVRIERILKGVKQRKKSSPEITHIVVKNRYEIAQDSVCIKSAMFSRKCNKWDKFYILYDTKTNDTLTLKPKKIKQRD